MSWLLLFLAGLLEAGWVVGLKQSDSLSKLPYVGFAGISMLLSLVLFAQAIQKIPVTHAYIIWVGVSVSAMSVVNASFFTEPILKQHYFSMA
jgi:quaternary ammonium compound-resistance protein SugE